MAGRVEVEAAVQLRVHGNVRGVGDGLKKRGEEAVRVRQGGKGAQREVCVRAHV